MIDLHPLIRPSPRVITPTTGAMFVLAVSDPEPDALAAATGDGIGIGIVRHAPHDANRSRM